MKLESVSLLLRVVVLTYPFKTFAFLPDTIFFNLITAHEPTFTMLFAHLPVSFVRSTIWPVDFSIAVLLVFKVSAYVFAPIRPGEDSFPMHLIRLPSSIVASTISPEELSLSMNNIVLELACEISRVRPFKSTDTMLLPTLILSLVNCIVYPNFSTVTMLKVKKPFTFILGSISVLKFSLTRSSVIKPTSIVVATIAVYKSS